MSRPCEERTEGGFVAGLEALAFGVLIFVFGTLLILNAWGVIDAKLAVTAAAREATRAVVEADPSVPVAALARAVALETLAGHGHGDADRLSGDPEVAGTIARCARLSVTVAYDVPAIRIPLVGGFGSGLTVRSTHTEVVDPFRSGLPGEASCDG
jgi:hypothetical protein